jgi:aminomethyltransferase
MVEFGGWELPLEYTAGEHGGTIGEHLRCRNAAVVFDVSHLGTVRLESGPEAIQAILTNDLDKISPGRAQYTLLLDSDGSVLDDLIVWWHPDGDVIDVIANATNTERVLAAVGGRDITTERAVLAVQGPHARSLLAEVFGAAAQVGRFRVAHCTWGSAQCVVAGTGYTGSDGVEIAVGLDHAAQLWQALVDAGITPAGLGARDTLRLEYGLALHGHELGPGITPLQAGLEWVVAFDKPEFVGRDALLAERARGIHRRLRGIVVEGRRPPRAGYSVLIDGDEVGQVTSGNYSAVLGCGVALAFVPPSTEIGTSVEIVARGHRLHGVIAATPFL